MLDIIPVYIKSLGFKHEFTCTASTFLHFYRGADKSLARPD